MKFNQKVVVPQTRNKAGGVAYDQSKRTQLTFAVLTTFLKDSFYESEPGRTRRILELAEQLPVLYVANLALYARNVFHLRSVSHLLAAYVAHTTKSVPGLRQFFNLIVVRLDDMIEIIAAYDSLYQVRRPNGKIKLPTAMKEGFKMAFERFDAYALAKYKAEGKRWSLIDVVNLVRPARTEALGQLVRGELKNVDTWESRVSAEGASAWRELILEDKLGYMALLRNLRNIAKLRDPELNAIVCDRIRDPERVRASKQLPFRFHSAYTILASCYGTSEMMQAVSDAADIALGNVPNLPNSLIVLDDSGSMRMHFPTAALLASALFKSSNSNDLMLCHEQARYVSANRSRPVLELASAISNTFDCGGGTELGQAFVTARQPYDRIIFVSDMQSWMEDRGTNAVYNQHRERLGDPTIVIIDLGGYGTSQFKDKVIEVAGWNEKVLEILSADPSTFIDEIANYNFKET